VTVVLKLGSSLVAHPGGAVRRTVLRRRAREIAAAVAAGEHVAVVSSGAIALGLHRLGLARRPRSVPKLQAASALGQARLQQAWEKALGREGVTTAQVLLTASDLTERSSYVNARNALHELFALQAVPIVNENDTTATHEITFGDNDALAAQVAILVRARVLVLLTEVEGVYTRTPGSPGAELVRDGAFVGTEALGGTSELGRCGMRSKVVAAQMASEAGIPTVIAGGTGDAVLEPILAGEHRGTRFHGVERELSAYKLWLRFAKEPVGTLHVDEGARRAVVEQSRSLLAVGVVRCEGRFEAGDVVELVAPDGRAFARGVVGASGEEIGRRPAGLEAVHRDRLVVY
jgi:glutamate 5-kinase